MSFRCTLYSETDIGFDEMGWKNPLLINFVSEYIAIGEKRTILPAFRLSTQSKSSFKVEGAHQPQACRIRAWVHSECAKRQFQVGRRLGQNSLLLLEKRTDRRRKEEHDS